MISQKKADTQHLIKDGSISLPTARAAPATPTLKELTNALKFVSNWHLLGINLDFSGPALATIERDYPGDNTRRKTEMLSRWLENTTSPSWEAVVQALRLMEAYAVADTIQRKYVTSTATRTPEGMVVSVLGVYRSFSDVLRIRMTL